MSFKKEHTYYVYITTNPGKTMLYTGVTNNLTQRLNQHYCNRGNRMTFSGKYYCYNLVYYEIYQYIIEAIAREKQIKRWTRKKKDKLIQQFNPKWNTLNKSFYIPE